MTVRKRGKFLMSEKGKKLIGIVLTAAVAGAICFPLNYVTIHMSGLRGSKVTKILNGTSESEYEDRQWTRSKNQLILEVQGEDEKQKPSGSEHAEPDDPGENQILSGMDMQVSLANNWDAGTIRIGDRVWLLPSTGLMAEGILTGTNVAGVSYQQERNESQTLDPYTNRNISYRSTDGSKILLRFENSTNQSQKLKDCKVIGISVDAGDNVTGLAEVIVLPGNITLGDERSLIYQTYGTPNESGTDQSDYYWATSDDEINFLYLSFRYQGDRMSGFTYTVQTAAVMQ